MHFSLNHPSYQMTRLPPYASLNSPNSNCLYPHYSLLLSYHLTMASVLLLLLLLVSFLPSPSLSLNQEGLYLLMARRKLDDPTNSLANWNPRDPTPCNWTGVTCNSVNSITTIDLSNLNIYGPFPPPLCLLPNLSFLSLSYNFFNSSISPSSLLPCSSVTHLDLSQNLFVGPLPSTLPSLPLLSYLDLSANNFSGDVPVSYSQFQNLKSLSLVNNLLSGPFPSLLTNLTSLQELNLSYNPFAPSELPSSLGNLTSLRMLWLAGCNLIGPIPSSIGSLSSLIDLDLSSNNLTGPIPHSLSQLSSVVQIELYSNTLTGTIPIGLSNLSSLRFFDAAMNQLTGSIPSDLFLAPKLESLHFYDNNLSGSLPPTLSQCLNLADLRLFSNRLTGPLPAGFGKSFPLVFLDLSDNYLSGEIPAGICDGGKLEQLLVLDNFFSGGIPESLGQCRTLLRVRLLNNRLSGEVPAAFWSLPHLWLLELSGNSLSGGISPMISGASNLSQLIVSDNQFTGPIPDEIGALPNLFQFSAANNRLTGPLPVSLANLGHLGQLDLHNNSLSGELLRGIQHWKKLTQLNLANNGLTGEIPEELGELPVLNYLDLSCNSLTGEIPTQLQNLKLNVFNVSDNQLSGALPPLFATGAYRNSFLGNPDLCGDPSGLCPSRHLGDPNQHRLIWVLRSILILAALVLIVGVVWFYWRYRSFEKAQPGFDKTKWTLTSFHKLGFSEYEILDCLDEDNVIGSGASGKVYKAVLSNGEAVAVKKLWAIGKKDDGRVDQSGEDSFEAEVATLGKIRHKNIVKLWCCCTHKDCKLLVYEHMPNGSLGDLLHSSKGGLLDWRMRHKIALDAAEGLSYLHHDCVPPIVHRDIKSNNILLDVDFGAKVADFGLAKVIGKGPNSMSAIAGSCGYIAPEYAYTLRVNEKSDIYSFGVVILELVTGKLPIDPEFGEKDLVKWVCSTLEQKGVEHVLDPKLNLCFRQEICKVLNIGLLCASSLPINRPSMRRVVKMLLEVAPENNPKKAKKDGKFSPYYYEDNASDNGSVV